MATDENLLWQYVIDVKKLACWLCGYKHTQKNYVWLTFHTLISSHHCKVGLSVVVSVVSSFKCTLRSDVQTSNECFLERQSSALRNLISHHYLLYLNPNLYLSPSKPIKEAINWQTGKLFSMKSKAFKRLTFNRQLLSKSPSLSLNSSPYFTIRKKVFRSCAKVT